MPGLRDALIAVEGLQTLRLRVEDEPDQEFSNMFWRYALPYGQALIKKLEPLMKERMKQTRGTLKYNLNTFLAAQREANLNIHGDGRLSEDKKPAFISSRTRNQLRNLENLDKDGIIPGRVRTSIVAIS